jgi:hypothetical protein
VTELFGVAIVIALGWIIDNARQPVTVVVVNEEKSPPPRRYGALPVYDINVVNDTVTLPQLLARQKAKHAAAGEEEKHDG